MIAGWAEGRRASSLVLLGLCMACVPKAPTEAPGSVSAQDRPSILCGLWSDSHTWLRLHSDGRFRWEEPRPCDDPPCPWQITEGRWRTSTDALRLDRDDGRGSHTLTWAVSYEPRQLSLVSRQGPRWDLAFREP